MATDQEVYRYEKPHQPSGGWGAAFFLLGALTGAATALVITPWKGDRLRNKLLEVSRNTKDSIRDYMQGARKTTTQELGKVPSLS